MQMAAHRPKKAFRGGKAGKFVFGKDTQLHQIGGVLNAVNVFRDPEQRLQVAQATLAFLHVRLDHISLALPLVPLVALVQLGLDKVAGGAGKQLVPQTLVQHFGQRVIAADKPVFQHGGADGEILAAQPDAILDRARRMANLQPQIPQHVQHGFDHVLGPGGDLVRGQEQ